MRNEIAADFLPYNVEEFKRLFSEFGEECELGWLISDSAVKKRVILMVSKEEHCLADLLYRWRTQDFSFDIVAVISNHKNLSQYVSWHDIPYYCIPITNDNKVDAFNEINDLIEKYDADTVVLARYMQILPANVTKKYSGRVINIHRSFLPSFVGAKPYHQAFKRGVKLIGATCHYVTEDLDEGLIIEQDVEKLVLSRGLRNHLEGRVLIHGSKTAVFN